MTPVNPVPADLLGLIRRWPAGQRLALARQILQDLEEDLPTSPPRKGLTALLGLIQTDGPTPTDEDCERLLTEELLRKYGR
jgi:hypothetical protein